MKDLINLVVLPSCLSLSPFTGWHILPLMDGYNPSVSGCLKLFSLILSLVYVHLQTRIHRTVDSRNKNCFRKFGCQTRGIPNTSHRTSEHSCCQQGLRRCDCSPMITYHKARDRWVRADFCLLLYTHTNQNRANKEKQSLSWKTTLKKNDVHSYPASSWQSSFYKTYLMFTTTWRLGRE